jgi:lipoate-protein ligase B
MTRPLDVIDLGHRDYLEVLDLQRALRLRRIAGEEPTDLLLLVEHPPVYTLGRSTKDTSLPMSLELLQRSGAQVIEIERGGDVTWHGPGQLVGYPILDLSQHRQDLHWYLRQVEQSLIETLAPFGIRAGTEAGRTGVWSAGRKIASIGIHVKQWITMHGFALNVDPDLSWFDRIVPCGLDGVVMTSMAREMGQPVDRAAVVEATIGAFAARFHLVPRSRQPETLPRAQVPLANQAEPGQS